MKRILLYLKPLKKRLVIGLFIKILGTVAELFIPFILSYILENVIITKDPNKIIFYGVIMAFCALIAGAGNIIANRMAAKMLL